MPAAAGRWQAGRCDCRPICQLIMGLRSWSFAQAVLLTYTGSGMLAGVTRSETVPSMQRLYAVMLRIRRLNATFV